ncbi:tachylectin-related carbohydrate-binding protein [Streptomyces sp. HMX112]|uniref:tachylectin-related carbohydrate-binding protein n=1 Tax=Streptomyces sp. HMX112 TaxID=3390850 RepID=UPI003A80FCBF
MTYFAPADLRRWGASVVAAAALPLTVAVPGTAQAAESATCTTNGRTFVTNAAGDLLQYTMGAPLTGSTFSAYDKAGSGWGSYGKVLAGPSGQFYAFKSDGTYYAHRTTTGAWDVVPKRVSTYLGWLGNTTDRNQATVDRAGWLWVADNTGQLYAYRYDATIATGGGLRSLGRLDKGWGRYNLITAGDSGVLFGRAGDGRLYRSRYDFTSQRWIERHVLVGSAAWGNFKSITGGGGDTLLAVNTTGEALYYRRDEATGDWPVLAKEVAAAGWQNFPDVTSAPDNCKLTSNHTPTAQPQQVESYSRTAVLQGSSGKLELAYTDNFGRLMHGRTDPADLSGVRWTPVSGNDAFSGQPSLSQHVDGRVTVTAHHVSGNVWQRDQTAADGMDWEDWRDLGGAMARRPVTAKTPSGLLAQFSLDAQGRPWYRLQIASNAETMSWMPLAGSGLTGPLTTVPVRGGVQLFARNATGGLSTALFGENGTLSAWAPIGSQSITGTPSVIVYPGYRMRIFATDPAGKVVTTAQTAESGPYGAWSPVGDAAHDADGPVTPLVVSGSPSAVLSAQSVEIVVRGTDGFLYNTGETASGSGLWRTWQKLGPESSATDPTAFTYTQGSGLTWAYTFRTADNQVRIYRAQ